MDCREQLTGIDKNVTKTTVITPKSSIFSMAYLMEIVEFRDLLKTFVSRDIRVRYKQTIIGGAWAIAQPFATMVVFSFFFGKLAKMPSDNIPYPIFSYAGLLLWTYFSNALTTSASSLVGNTNLITKIYFPRIIIPVAATLTGLLDYAISFIIMVGMIIWFQTPISWNILFLPLVLIITWLLACGLGLWLSALNVKFRDVRFVIPFFLQLLMYITPVIYPASVADRFRFVLALNPMTGLIETHRAVLLAQKIPWIELSWSVVYTLLIVIFGVVYFRKVERSFADII